MVKYLQMDGVDDFLTIPSITFNRIVIDHFMYTPSNHFYIFDIRPTLTAYLFEYSTGANGRAGITSLVVDGNTTGSLSDQANRIVFNQRQTLDVTLASIPTTSFTFYKGGNTRGNIYNIKIYNGTTLVAHYDMSQGNVQDVSGNGNHATLTGGTWLDDGTGGGDTGTDGSITLGLTQQIYSDSVVNLSLSQQIYVDISANLNLVQSIYRDTETLLGLNQMIYRDDSAVLPLTQAIYRESELGLNLRQEIYAEAESILNLIQEFYEDSQTYITLQLIQQIYKESSIDLPMTQSIYKDSEIGLPLRQEMYEEKETNLSLNQTVYKDDSSVLNLSQTIYNDSFSSLNLVQQMYTEGEINLSLLLEIRDDLIQYNEVIRFVLDVTRKQVAILDTTRKQAAELDITQRMQSELKM
jgi:hypothetical protein